MSDAGGHDDKLAPEPFERSHTLLQAQHEREEVFRAAAFNTHRHIWTQNTAHTFWHLKWR